MKIVLDGGCNEVEDPTALAPNVVQTATGAEYRVGAGGIFVARGRKSLGSVASTTWRSLYSLGFDAAPYALVQSGDTYYTGQVTAAGISLSWQGAAGSSTERTTGVHYANRHYVVNGQQNRAFELISGVTHRQMGMTKPISTLGVSVTQGAGSFTASTGLTYWLTEYDSTRGIESVYGATSASTGAFSGKNGVVVTISGATINQNTDQLRIYRTTNGGAWPDGGLIATISGGSSSFTDTNTNVSSLTTPAYGVISVGGLDYDRDTKPPEFTFIAGPFQNSLVGFPANDPRSIAYTAAGYPESCPDIYRIPIQTERHDEGVCMVPYGGFVAVFTRDTVHRLSRLPREVDSAFAPAESLDVLTIERGCVSSKGACMFTIPGRGAFIAFVARDGIWATSLVGSPIPLTDGVAWTTRIDAEQLAYSSLENDSLRRRLVFSYRSLGATYNDSIMYLDYQAGDLRVTHPNHGALADMEQIPYRGLLTLLSVDSRADNGGLYAETVQDRDDSYYLNTTGDVSFHVRTAEYQPLGAHSKSRLRNIAWMHDATPATVRNLAWIDRQANPEIRTMDFRSRGAADIGIGREVQSLSLEVTSSGVNSYGLHWLDIDVVEETAVGSRGGT